MGASLSPDLRAVAALALLWAALAACGGSPGPGGACQSNRDCTGGQTCISGTCTSPGREDRCRTDDDCPLDSLCDVAAGECRLLGATDAGVGPDGASEDACDPADAGPRDAFEGICERDEQCGTPPVDVCVAGQCVLGCGQPGGLTCTGGSTCEAATGRCVTATQTCANDSACGAPSRICEGGQCVPGCGVDRTLCDATELCDTNTGRCVPRPMPCATDAACAPPATVCEGGQCIGGCGVAGGLQCGGSTPHCSAATGRCTATPGCTLDAECAATNQICVMGRCAARCDAPGGPGCPAGQVCNAGDGRCITGGLALGTTCSSDAQCLSLLCLGLNVGATTRSLCTEPCGATSQCPLDFTCSDVSGMSFCLPESLTTPPATWDTPSGGVCSQTVNTCQSGWCNQNAGRCIETCSRNADCASFGGQCWTYEQTPAGSPATYDHLCFSPTSGGSAGAACNTNAECRSGICNRYSRTCAAHCCRDSDCAPAESCAVYDIAPSSPVKICAPRSPTAGTLPLGATCVQPSECESEVCAATDPANPASPRRCSTLCCRNQDCSVLPTGGRCRPGGSPVANTIVGVCAPG